MATLRNPRRSIEESPKNLLTPNFGGGIGKTTSFRLVSQSPEPDTVDNIRDFREFKRLRKVYLNLCELPETLFEDWIACCLEHIARDIHGNTPDENAQNVRITALFLKFQHEYTLIVTSNDAPEVRREKLNESLLALLRSLLGKPCRLADELITLTGFPIEA